MAIEAATRNARNNPQRDPRQTQGPTTWATIASQPTPPQSTVLRVHITDQKEKEEIGKMTGREIVEKIGVKGIVGARADNKGVKLFTAHVQDKKALEINKEWTLKIGSTAKVSHQQYMVIAHGVPRTFDTQRDTPNLQRQNQVTAPGLQITKTAWVKKKIEEGKRASSLILWVATPEQANKVLDQGFTDILPQSVAKPHQSAHTVLVITRPKSAKNGRRTQDAQHVGENTRHGQTNAQLDYQPSGERGKQG
uniref:Uncharacterized protein n=1 Tax=Passalora fulva TaxID=5499 RepID=A0A9Q8UTI2_PASFU